MIYIVISLLMLIPFFLIIKRLLISSHIHHNAAGILFTVMAITFHMYIFRFNKLPFVNVAISHSSVVLYGAIVIALLYALVYSICFKRYYGKTVPEKI
ncbi:hypothetical protein Xmau_02144 [Xenorhabdus mauleonii]|uniref:Uncharacterized protein n=1 Tax=Xenorhabdus mauleonii TaxID=351675 RepID=A0A1I3QGW5_9GAMM|nr:hypothetical protein Xmau_02144 [Xenorhabdus mauleonii]SFJ33333.1 hypothetical protein SAMN05421680_107164 [Xenorhabdus mauleonii]